MRTKLTLFLITLTTVAAPSASAVEPSGLAVSACIETPDVSPKIRWTVMNTSHADITLLEEMLPWAPSTRGARLKWRRGTSSEAITPGPMGSGRNLIKIRVGESVSDSTDLSNYVDNAAERLRHDWSIEWTYTYAHGSTAQQFAGSLSKGTSCHL